MTKTCPYCQEPCAQRWCGRCERVLPEDPPYRWSQEALEPSNEEIDELWIDRIGLDREDEGDR